MLRSAVLGFFFTLPGLVRAFDSSALEKHLTRFGTKATLSVRDLQTGTELVARGADTPMMPASVAKLASTACALKTLGPEHQFTTQFLTQGKLEAGVLKGALVIRGQGDPQYVIEDLRENIERIREVHGIEEIEGSLVFDVSYFGVEKIPMTEDFEGDSGRSFTAPLTAVPFNFNSFSVWVAPDLSRNKVRTSVLPRGAVDVKLQGSVVLGVGNSKNVALRYDPLLRLGTLSGTLGRDAESKGIYRSVNDPYGYFFDVFKRLWLESGGRWAKPGFEISKTETRNTRLLFAHPSKSLAKLVIDINKLSLNVGAELVMLAAGTVHSQKPATLARAAAALDQCLKDWSVDAWIKVSNASGLSRSSRVTAGGLSQLLVKVHKEYFAPEFEASLPLLGADGTMKTRLPAYKGLARLKTGTLSNVRSVAGLVTSKAGRTYALALIFNNVSGFSPELVEAEDKILKALIEQP